MDDRELLRLLEQDPESGVRQMTQQYAGLVFSIITGRAGGTASAEDVEECAGDVIFEVYRRRDSIDPEKGSLRAFLSVVARRRAVNLYRKTAREAGRRSGAELPEETAGPGFEESLMDEEERRSLTEKIRSLGEPDSEIIFRRYYFGQKSKEIAADLGMTPGAVDTRLSRALGKLRAMFGGENDG